MLDYNTQEVVRDVDAGANLNKEPWRRSYRREGFDKSINFNGIERIERNTGVGKNM